MEIITSSLGNIGSCNGDSTLNNSGRPYRCGDGAGNLPPCTVLIPGCNCNWINLLPPCIIQVRACSH